MRDTILIHHIARNMPSPFDSYPGFEPDPNASFDAEFARLARHARWKPKSKKWWDKRAEFYQTEFAALYGENASRLQNWQSLCRELRIRKQPIESITQCKKVRILAG
jgi:hypothetical protein